MKMRSVVFSLMAAFLLSIPMLSCKKDKDDEEPAKKKSFMNYDGKEYLFSKGVLAYYGDPDAKAGTYNFDIVLYSEGLGLNQTTGMLTGQGHTIYFELFSSSATALVPGTYAFDSTGSYLANSFDYGYFMINYVAADDEAEIDLDIEGGTLQVAKTGDVYTLTINVTASDGKQVTGSYTGTLTYFDFSGIKKK